MRLFSCPRIIVVETQDFASLPVMSGVYLVNQSNNPLKIVPDACLRVIDQQLKELEFHGMIKTQNLASLLLLLPVYIRCLSAIYNTILLLKNY
ncbi:MAG: hypothetical protein LIO93_08845 [Bacteroidales bacterium]|nr:hypothetical protein [Bacteroidales bacterium]